MILTFLIRALLVFVFTTPLAQAFQPAEFSPNVVDETGALSPSEVQQLNEEIQKLRESADVWAAVYLVKTLDGESIESAAEKTFRKWELGQKGRDNGLLLMFALQDRRARIEIGYGLEGEITDLHAKRVLDEVILPRFKSHHYAEGLGGGLHAIGYIKTKDASFLESGDVPQLEPEESPKESPSEFSKMLDLPEVRGGLYAWLAWVGILIFFPILARALETVYKGRRPTRDRSPPHWLFLRLFLALNPGIFIALSPLILDKVLDGGALRMKNWGVWAALVLLSPAIIRGVSYWVGRRRPNKNPVFRMAKAPLLLYLLDLEGAAGLGKKLFLLAIPGIYIAAVPAFWESDYEPGDGTWVGSALLILYLVINWFGTVVPLISEKAYNRSEARKRLRRIQTRLVGTREIFGRSYTHTRSSSRSISSSGSSSRSSSSSGGGRSGGGGASSSW